MADNFDAINENAARANEADAKAEAAYQEFLHQRRRAAVALFVRRLATAFALFVGVWVATYFNLIAPVLAIPLEAVILSWVTGLTGAWLQYTGKGLFK